MTIPKCGTCDYWMKKECPYEHEDKKGSFRYEPSWNTPACENYKIHPMTFKNMTENGETT